MNYKVIDVIYITRTFSFDSQLKNIRYISLKPFNPIALRRCFLPSSKNIVFKNYGCEELHAPSSSISHKFTMSGNQIIINESIFKRFTVHPPSFVMLQNARTTVLSSGDM